MRGDYTLKSIYKIRMEDKKILLKFNIIAIICITIFGIIFAQKQLQNDTFYTIKIGESIIENQGVDMKDHFSWHKDLTYTYPHWLYDTSIYLIYNTGYSINGEAGGMLAIYISTCMFSVILGLLIYYTNVKLNKNRFCSLILTLLTLFLLRNFLAARAQLVSFILFVLEIYFIEQFLNTKKIRYGICLFIIATLIANMHAAVWYMFFILALPYVAEFFITLVLKKWPKFVEKIPKIKFEKRENVKWLILILIICAFAGLLTPQNTFEPYTHLIKLMKGNTTEYIGEHTPITLINSKETLIYLSFILGFLMFTKAKITVKDLFMLAGLIFMTLASGRQRSMLILIGMYSINIILVDYIKECKKYGDYKLMQFCTKSYIMVSILMITLAFGMGYYIPKRNIEYVNKETYPVRSAKYILSKLDIENIKLYNGYNYGSYLLYEGIPVFIDSRCDLYTPEFNGRDIFMDAHNISGIAEDYDKKFKNYGITHLLIKNSSKLNMILNKDEGYQILFKDDYFCVWERIVK